MKGKVLRKDFAQALNTASRFIAHRAQLPILSNILIKADKTKIHLYATNLEMSVALSMGAKIEVDGEIAIPSRVVTDLVSSLSGEEIDLEVKQEVLHINSASFKGTVAAMNSADFPSIPQTIEKQTKSFKADVLLGAISDVLYSVSNDETRPVLSGVLFKAEGDTLLLVASDGYRLAQKKIKIDDKGHDFSVIIPKSILSELGKIVKEGSVSFELRKSDNQVVFGSKDSVLSSRTVEGQYPPFETVIERPTSISVSLDKHELQQAMKISSVYARDGGNAVKFNVGPDGLVVSAQSSSIGSHETKVDAKVDGGESEVSLNYKFVEELLNVVDSENVNIQLQDSSSPVKFKAEGDSELLHLVMPLKS